MRQIQLDKPRNIEFNMFALSQYEMRMRKELEDKTFSAFEMKSMGVSELLYLTYYGCIGGDSDFELTVEQVAKHLTQEVIKEVTDAFIHDLNASQKK